MNVMSTLKSVSINEIVKQLLHRLMQLKLVVIVLSLSLIAERAAAQAFVHPGILHSQEDFDRMKAKVAAGEQPWKVGYDVLSGNTYAQLSWGSHAVATVTRSGSGDNVVLLYRDVAAAYQQAVRWKVTGDSAYANKAVEILNAWSLTHTTLTGDADRYLASGLFGYQFANAAEIMRGYPGFDLTRFQNYMLNVFYYPLVERFLVGNSFGNDHNDACITNYWANWDLANMAAMLAIGVLCDNRDIYNKGITYFKTGAGNGSIKHAVPFVFSDKLGQWQESGRDQGHTLLGVGLMASFCEIAWNQGDDMYGYDDNRFRKGAEYAAKYNYGEDVPFTTYWWGSGTTCASNNQTVVSNAGRGEYRPIWEMIYNHYSRRLGQKDEIKYITAMAERVRPEGGPASHATTFDQPGFGTLTHTLEPSCGPTAISPNVQVNGGSWQQISFVNIASGATVKLGPQPIVTNGWKWSSGQTTREITISNITSDTTFTAYYKNSCGALSVQRFVINLNQVNDSIAHYTFEQNTNDVTGKAKHATAVNGPVYVSGKYGSAISLDGTNDHLTLPAGIVSAATDMTIATWVKQDAGKTWARIFDFGTGTSTNMFLAPKSGIGTLRFAITKGGVEQTVDTDSIPSGQWVHVAVRLFGDQGSLYVNGELVSTNNNMTHNPYDLGSTTNNYIGRSQWPDPYFDGSIDDFRIYNYALSDLDIKKLYDATPDPKVTLTAPLANEVFTTGNSITLKADATAFDATISKVEFYDNTTLLGQDTSSPYEFTWTNAALGSHSVSARVTDSKSQFGVSESSSIMVVRRMALHYTFDKATNDISGNSNHGVVAGTPLYDVGKIDSAIVLNGTDQYISLPATMQIQAKSVTISGWINPALLNTWTRVFDLGSSTSNYMFLTLNVNGKPRFAIRSNGGGEEIVNSSTALTTGVWTHFAITYQDKICRFYLNGTLVGENTFMKTNPADLGVLSTSYIGKSQFSADPLYNGKVDDFRLYNRALSAAEIADLIAGKNIPDGTYTVMARHSGKMLDVANDGRNNGSNVQQFASNGCGCQKWIVAYQGNGQYTLVGVNSGKNLDVAALSTADGANVQIWASTGANNQKFTIKPTAEGYYRITAVHSGKAVDVSGASTANGANVDQWSYFGGLNQQWQFTSVTSGQIAAAPGGELALELNVDEASDNELSIYPNPVHDQFTVKLNGFSNDVTVTMFDANGKQLYTSIVRNAEHIVNTSKLSPGLYFVKVSDRTKSLTRKIIKK